MIVHPVSVRKADSGGNNPNRTAPTRETNPSPPPMPVIVAAGSRFVVALETMPIPMAVNVTAVTPTAPTLTMSGIEFHSRAMRLAAARKTSTAAAADSRYLPRAASPARFLIEARGEGVGFWERDGMPGGISLRCPDDDAPAFAPCAAGWGFCVAG